MKKIYIVISLIIISYSVAAQAPWTVISSDYEFSMNITGKLKLDNNFVEDVDTWLGAFVGNECRGVVQATEVNSGDFYYFLTLYSNTSTGEEVLFKFHDATNTVHEFTQSVLFVADAVYGNPDNPYLLMLPEAYEQTDFLSFSVDNQVEETEIDATGKTVNIGVTPETDIQNLITSFEVPYGAKVLINDIVQESGISVNDFTNSMIYTINGIDGKSMEWTVSISKVSSINQTILNNIEVYPTIISNNQLFVKASESLKYKIFNILGNVIQNGNVISGPNTIQLNSKCSGIIFLKLTNSKNQVKTVRLLIH